MPKLFSSKKIIKVLVANGFYLVSQKGSHLKYRKDGNPTLTVIVPANRMEIPVKLSIVFRFKVSSAFRSKLSTPFRSKLSTC